ncbi:DoxX family protein [Sorangium sp. So ce321]
MSAIAIASGQRQRERAGAAAAVVARIARTEDDGVALALRVVLAAVMFPHGAQHLLGWFGGFGYAGTRGWMVSIGIPGPLATLAIVTELVAPLALLAGAFGRLAAAGLGALLLVAATTHLPNGFFMNWLGNQAGEGWEYHALAIAIAAAIVVRGSGAWSVDRRLG